MKRIQTFTFDEDKEISAAWSSLKDYRRKLVAPNPNLRQTSPNEVLFLILTRSLPISFKRQTHAFIAQPNLKIQEKMDMLIEHEMDLREEEVGETARFSKANAKGSKKRQQTYNSDSDENPGLECHLCHEDHFFRFCKHVELATVSDNPSESSSDNSEESDSDEVCNLSQEDIRKIAPSWPAEIGASSHMSDIPSLFRHLKSTKLRRIQVGGGVLYSDAKGTVKVACEDSSSMLLKNDLFFPKLGTDLLSARRLCESGLVGSFNSNWIYFKLKGKIIIKAKKENGSYIINHISSCLRETAFSSIDHDMDISNEQKLPVDGFSNDNFDVKAPVTSLSRDLNESDKDRYLLFHRCFAHLRPKKIGKLHTVTNLDKQIKIPKDVDICKVCALANMRNSIPKTLANHVASKLALVQFDIAGPFPTSLQGNRYFVLMIDVFTRKNWVRVLKTRGEAKIALEE
ncbi:hypothetical protein K3495_g8444 [Podosphaera aphanis]|nr:hypothetical protein K3495_g8444 [Podosphaera aphanis]